MIFTPTEAYLLLGSNDILKLESELNEIGKEVVMAKARVNECGPQMAGFLRQLRNAIRKIRDGKSNAHCFKVNIYVADELACDELTLGAEFSKIFFLCLGAKEKKG